MLAPLHDEAVQLSNDPKDIDEQMDESFKQIARGLVQIVNGLAAIRNMASDGHTRQVRPQVRHARVTVNSAKTVASFLVEVYLARPVTVMATSAVGVAP